MRGCFLLALLAFAFTCVAEDSAQRTVFLGLRLSPGNPLKGVTIPIYRDGDKLEANIKIASVGLVPRKAGFFRIGAIPQIRLDGMIIEIFSTGGRRPVWPEKLGELLASGPALASAEFRKIEIGDSEVGGFHVRAEFGELQSRKKRLLLKEVNVNGQTLDSAWLSFSGSDAGSLVWSAGGEQHALRLAGDQAR